MEALSKLAEQITAAMDSLGIYGILLIYGVGILSIALQAISYQMKNRSRILYINFSSTFGWMTYFVLNGNLTSACMNLIGLGRCMIFMNRGKRHWASSRIWLWVFLVLFSCGALLPYHDWRDLFPFIASAFTTIGYFSMKELHLRVINLCGYVFWIANSLSHGYWVALCSDIVTVCSLLAALYLFHYKHYKTQKKKTA